jgi:hypothetical protein
MRPLSRANSLAVAIGSALVLGSCQPHDHAAAPARVTDTHGAAVLHESAELLDASIVTEGGLALDAAGLTDLESANPPR